jgi:hypothetical protein
MHAASTRKLAVCFFLYLLSMRTAVCVNHYQVQVP